MYPFQTLIASFRELTAQLSRSTRATWRYPQVYFGVNAAIRSDCNFGRNVRINNNTRLAATTIGDYSYFGGGSRLQNVTIGKFCSIGPDVRIGLGLHPVDHVSTYPGFYSTKASGSAAFTDRTLIKEHAPVEIGHDVWIGAGAMVTSDVAPYAIVAGVSRHLRDRFKPEMAAFLLEFAWWDRDETFLREHAPLFGRPEAFSDRVTA